MANWSPPELQVGGDPAGPGVPVDDDGQDHVAGHDEGGGPAPWTGSGEVVGRSGDGAEVASARRRARRPPGGPPAGRSASGGHGSGGLRGLPRPGPMPRRACSGRGVTARCHPPSGRWPGGTWSYGWSGVSGRPWAPVCGRSRWPPGGAPRGAGPGSRCRPRVPRSRRSACRCTWPRGRCSGSSRAWIMADIPGEKGIEMSTSGRQKKPRSARMMRTSWPRASRAPAANVWPWSTATVGTSVDSIRTNSPWTWPT